MHDASSDVQNGKILEHSGVQLKAVSLFVMIDTICQSCQRALVSFDVGSTPPPPAIAVTG
jgi:hypothetical protein